MSEGGEGYLTENGNLPLYHESEDNPQKAISAATGKIAFFWQSSPILDFTGTIKFYLLPTDHLASKT